jgi:UDP-N-acetylmuramyl pentapeptide phosphotransferase/UDP-N-acetylglucosamine-1-phosphate transferase
MGDNGSMIIGLLLSVLVIRFINTNYSLPSDNPYHFNSTITSAACLIIVPLLDTLRIVILRLIKRQSLFRPDKSHIHHTILRMGFSHARTTVILIFLQLFFILIAIAFRGFDDRIMLPIVLAVAGSLSIALNKLAMGKTSPRV